MEMEVTGKRPRGAPKKRWKDTVCKDMRELGVTKDDAQDRDLWRREAKQQTPRMRGTNAKEEKKLKAAATKSNFDPSN
ncbi:hypothetical protein Y032_0040g287 [Ancylostoma ceylanicum]|uniref:Uncharacterized protein n=1 Tax=Ancylostoma ceylanicum TaxID=53326 RepID=A0A016UGW3_9BILA|nr:hypothetical protein Y032_0040g287 [Ancylostoma ceylanicum]